MTKKKTYIITLSKVFLQSHPRAGEKTNFREKYESGDKLHTLRANVKYWDDIIDKVNSGEGVLHVKQWSGKPYNSKQELVEILTSVGKQLVRINPTGKGKYCVSNEGSQVGTYIKEEMLANNDGLSSQDFRDWFEIDKMKKQEKVMEAIIIHFTNFRY